MAAAKYITFMGFVVAFNLSGAMAKPIEDFGVLADNAGVMNAWRLIPETLLSRCVKEFPEKGESLNRTYESWQVKHQAFSARIDKVLADVASILAPALEASAIDSRKKIDDFTRTQIEENYLSGGKLVLKETCDSYATIVGNLSDPGRVATIRGFMYHVESIIHDQQQSR